MADADGFAEAAGVTEADGLTVAGWLTAMGWLTAAAADVPATAADVPAAGAATMYLSGPSQNTAISAVTVNSPASHMNA